MAARSMARVACIILVLLFYSLRILRYLPINLQSPSGYLG